MIRCPYCDSKDVIKRGIRQTAKGNHQRFSCKDCNRRFVLDNDQQGCSRELKISVMGRVSLGASYRKIAQDLGIRSPATVERWDKEKREEVKKTGERYRARNREILEK